MARKYSLPVTISRKDYLKGGSDSAFRESIYVMVQSVSRLLKCRDAFAHALGLTASQFAVMMGTGSQQGADGVSIKKLADHVALAPTHVTTEVGRLERKKILQKRPSPSDGRSVLVSLSPTGEQEIARMAPLVRSVNDLLFKDISPEALAVASDVARTLIANSEYAMAELRRNALRGGKS
jgi:DNA-binding MarR family transcriptional regulator